MVENEFGCKDEKVKEDKYEHCPQQVLKIVQQFLQICLSSYKSPKKLENFVILRSKNCVSWITLLLS